jgi:hypothetical protein
MIFNKCLTLELCCGTNRATIKSDALHETPPHQRTQLDFTATWLATPASIKHLPQSNAAWAVSTNDLLYGSLFADSSFLTQFNIYV